MASTYEHKVPASRGKFQDPWAGGVHNLEALECVGSAERGEPPRASPAGYHAPSHAATTAAHNDGSDGQRDANDICS